MGSQIGGSEWYDKELNEQLVLNIPADTQLYLWMSEAFRKLKRDNKENGHNEGQKNVFSKA